MGVQSPVVDRINKEVNLGVVFAINLDLRLKGNDYKQEYVAHVSGKTQQYISKLMDPTSARINPTLVVIEGISQGLDIPAGELLLKQDGIDYELELKRRLSKKAEVESRASAG